MLFTEYETPRLPNKKRVSRNFQLNRDSAETIYTYFSSANSAAPIIEWLILKKKAFFACSGRSHEPNSDLRPPSTQYARGVAKHRHGQDFHKIAMRNDNRTRAVVGGVLKYRGEIHPLTTELRDTMRAARTTRSNRLSHPSLVTSYRLHVLFHKLYDRPLTSLDRFIDGIISKKIEERPRGWCVSCHPGAIRARRRAGRPRGLGSVRRGLALIRSCAGHSNRETGPSQSGTAREAHLFQSRIRHAAWSSARAGGPLERAVGP